ncbi:hypothetical protein AWP65_22530 [Escherichia coli]|nr:hypothetical protein AWP52_19880 [Escherichia coli]OKV94808.1 hypothetical protein AWP65_22530 [Escherichia coli]
MRYRLASPTKSNPIRSRIIQCPPGFFRTSSESIQCSIPYLLIRRSRATAAIINPPITTSW